jgi:DNA-binding PadR family transcriptional regulator
MESVADKFENAMKKGFIHSIILSLLNRGPCHGYQIKKEILDSNLGYWNLQDSTLYTVLKQLTEKGLIEYNEESAGERKKKVYHLTQEGEKLYQIIAKRQNRIYNSTFSLLSLILQEEESEFTDLIRMMKLFSPISADPSFMESKSIHERILIMQEVKGNILKRIEGFQNMVQTLDTKIDFLQKSVHNE